MKTSTTIATISAIVFAMLIEDTLARGPRGGSRGGGSRGGMSRGGAGGSSFNRGSSQNRSSSQTRSLSSGRGQSHSRSSSQDRGQSQSRSPSTSQNPFYNSSNSKRSATRPTHGSASSAGRPSFGRPTNSNPSIRSADRNGRRDAGTAQRPTDIDRSDRAGRPEPDNIGHAGQGDSRRGDGRHAQVDQRRDQRTERADSVRNQVGDRDREFLSRDWRPNQSGGESRRRNDQSNSRYSGHYWWTTSSWSGVTGWVADTSWNQPVNYSYGENITYVNGNVYADGQQVATGDQYAQQAIDLAHIPVETMEEQSEWMPLGVFAMVDERQGKPNMFLQLAVSKNGVISGTYKNSLTNSTMPVEGNVDRQTQRAAWSIGNNKSNVLETGIFNLTKNETPILVHFGSQRTQQWLLVRLDPPQSNLDGG